MEAGVAIRAVNLGKRFLRDGWEPHRGLHKVADRTLRLPLELLGRVTGRRPSAEPTDPYLWALRGLSFVIRRGESIGLIGANGAGKSVLLKILSRVTQPTEGFAEVRGRVASILEGSAGFHPELTGRENVQLTGSVFGMEDAEIRRKLERIEVFAEIGASLDKPVKHYSTGMVARLALGIAVHLDRDVLLIDETLATGDEAFRAKCIQTLRGLSQQGRTVIFVSHDAGLVSQLCQRCLYLEDGRLSDEGPTADILSRYGAYARLGADGRSAPSL